MPFTKRLLVIALVTSLAVMPMPTLVQAAAGDEFISGGIKYRVLTEAGDIGTVEVVENSYSGDITIPESVHSGSITYTVTAIGSRAFMSCGTLTRINIPNSVTIIGYEAFFDCASLTTVSIPASVTSIGTGAFGNCRSLTSISLPDGVTAVSAHMFNGCLALTSITIPNSVTFIENYAFSGCTSLTSISIPEGVTVIGSNAFYRCTGLTRISIPEDVFYISSNALDACSSLTSIVFTRTTPPTFGEEVFLRTPAGLLVSVPVGTKAAYADALSGKLPADAAIKELVNITAILGVSAPERGAVPSTTVTETEQYTGTIAWEPAHSRFAASKEYTATITLSPKDGYTLTGVAANSFTAAGAALVSNAADSGVITAVFPATSAPPDRGSISLTPEQLAQELSTNQQLDLNFPQVSMSLSPEAIPALNGGTLLIEVSMIKDYNTLNNFFLAYPGQKGLKGFSVCFSLVNNGRSESITQLNGEITLTFDLSHAELAGIDPGTLTVYEQGEDGSITPKCGEFNWDTDTVSVVTSHPGRFFIMGKEGVPVQRLCGNNRYETAAAISAEGWQTSNSIVLTSGTNFPDALAGTTLAGFLDAPVLLTAKDILPDETLAEINRLKPVTIYILGGTSVIAQAIEDQLAHDYTVVRLFGSNRYETAAKIGQFIMDSTPMDTAIITTASNYPDALSIAPFSGRIGLPVLFTEKTSLNALTRQALLNWDINKVILTGGTSVISEEVEAILENELQLTVTRLSGADRYLTSLEIAEYFSANYQMQYTNAALATGEDFPDALAGASLAAKAKFPVLLVGKEGIHQDLKGYLAELNLEKLYVFGGKGVISDKVREAIS